MTTTGTDTAKCGKSFNRKVKGGAVKSYRCTKPKGHDTGENKTPHGLVQNRKEVNIPAGILTGGFETVPDTEYVALVQRERSAEQQIVDGHVQEAYAAWVEAGKPTKPQDSPRKRYLVPAEHVEGIRTMLHRAGDFHGKRVQVAPAVRHESGNMSVQFRVTDRTGKPSDIRNQDSGGIPEATLADLRKTAQEMGLSEEQVAQLVGKGSSE